jgi:GNAT superfamily N-acetyltransferase
MLHIVPDSGPDGFPAVPDYDRCLRCNRVLVNPKWRRLGYGPSCNERERYARVMAEAKAHGWTN